MYQRLSSSKCTDVTLPKRKICMDVRLTVTQSRGENPNGKLSLKTNVILNTIVGNMNEVIK